MMGSIGVDRRRNVKKLVSTYRVNKAMNKDRAYVYKFVDFDNFSFKECNTISEASDVAVYDDKIIYRGEFVENI